MQQQYDFNRGAIRPIQCLSDACEMLKGQYGAFLGVLIIGLLLMIVGACIPLVPPMICGVYLCLFAIMHRQPFNSSTLFKGFDFFGQSFLASLVMTIPIFVLLIVMQLGFGGLSVVIETLKVEKNPKPEDVLPILFGLFGFLVGMYVLIVAVALVLGTLMAFVYPLIVDRKLGAIDAIKLSAIDAIKLSFRAVMANFFGVVGLMLLGQLLMFAGVMLFYVGALFVAPVVFAAWAIAYRRVFSALCFATGFAIRRNAAANCLVAAGFRLESRFGFDDERVGDCRTRHSEFCRNRIFFLSRHHQSDRKSGK